MERRYRKPAFLRAQKQERRDHPGVSFRPIYGTESRFTEDPSRNQLEVLAAGTIGHLSAHAPLLFLPATSFEPLTAVPP